MTSFSFGGRTVRVAAVAAIGLVLAACQSTPQEGVMQPVVTPVTKQSHSLRTVPAPAKRIPVAVYDFPDLTGQYKERENVQSLSRAVTQGGAPMLIKALQDAGERRWFSVLDRARLDDVLKERQIVTEMRRLYRGEQRVPASVMPPLSHAGIIVQGGIIGYDTNTRTGGIGARYLGIGGDTKWQQDTVTVTLRAVSTNSGEVLATVTTHKAIASQSLQGGVFRYVALDRILEAEAGVTQNEPKQIAVQQAVDKAVVSLIMEGAELGVWKFNDPKAGQEAIAAYHEEKYGSKITLAARTPQPPATRDATKVVETVPATPSRATSQRQTQPQAQPQRQQPQVDPDLQPGQPRAPAPPPVDPERPDQPPPATDDEVVGSLSSENSGAGEAGADTPPPSGDGEVVGALAGDEVPLPSSRPAGDAVASGEEAQQVAAADMARRFSQANAPQPRGFER